MSTKIMNIRYFLLCPNELGIPDEEFTKLLERATDVIRTAGISVEVYSSSLRGTPEYLFASGIIPGEQIEQTVSETFKRMPEIICSQVTKKEVSGNLELVTMGVK